jgi:hypothetical protein
MEEKVGFMQYMNETKSVSRWFVLRIGLLGMLAGVLLATVFVIGGVFA